MLVLSPLPAAGKLPQQSCHSAAKLASPVALARSSGRSMPSAAFPAPRAGEPRAPLRPLRKDTNTNPSKQGWKDNDALGCIGLFWRNLDAGDVGYSFGGE